MKYRITKYNPQFRNHKGAYYRPEWTSCTDIGHVFLGKTLTCKEYLFVENAYISTIMLILGVFHSKSGYVDACEKRFSLKKIQRRLKSVGLRLHIRDRILFNKVQNNYILKYRQIPSVLRLVLRECIWCKIACTNVNIEFGYDYYIYIYCDVISEDIIKTVRQKGIYIEML